MAKSPTVIEFAYSLRSRFKKKNVHSPIPEPASKRPRMEPPSPFPFLLLPPELRNQIYSLVLCIDSPISLLPLPENREATPWMPDPKPVTGVHPALFLVSRTVRGEAIYPYYTSNTFFLSPSSIPASIESTFGTGCLYDNLRQIRRWHIDVNLTKYTYRENLHGSLSLRSFWEKQSESDVAVEVHLRLSKDTRKSISVWEVGALIETGVSWWRGVVGSGKGDFGLKVFLHTNAGPDIDMLEAAKCAGFRLLSKRRNGETVDDAGPIRRGPFEWMLEDRGRRVIE